MNNKQYATLIDNWRRESGLTQFDVGEILGVSISTASRLLRGEQHWHRNYCAKIEAAMRAEGGQLLVPEPHIINPYEEGGISGTEVQALLRGWDSSVLPTFAFQRLVPMSIIPKTLLEPHLESLLNDATKDPTVKETLFGFHLEHGTVRREQFKQGVGADTITFMLWSEVENHFSRRFPFEQCDRKLAIKWIDYVTDECVDKLNFPLRIIDDKLLDSESLAYIEPLLMVQLFPPLVVLIRFRNFFAFASPDPPRVEQARRFFLGLQLAFKQAESKEPGQGLIRLRTLRTKLNSQKNFIVDSSGDS